LQEGFDAPSTCFAQNGATTAALAAPFSDEGGTSTMVAEPFRDSRSGNEHSRSLTEKQLGEMREWLRPLQQALRLEAENGFSNFQGRQEYFHAFLARQLEARPDLPFSAENQCRLDELARSFAEYLNISEGARRRLVTGARQFLHSFAKRMEAKTTLSAPRLKSKSLEMPEANSPDSVCRDLTLDSPLLHVRGVGLKNGERLAGIGILSIRDLLEHYPRDYLDYSCMKNIDDLVNGETATIVATVRRCKGFTSPRNRNLSILELQLQDQTGRLKLTRFLAGRRFSNPAYLKSQTCLYPQGATVAVSGLVKCGPYGKNFHEPLIEVLQSRHSSLRSNSIGRLLPVYSLTEGITAERYRDFVEIVLPLAVHMIDPLPMSSRTRRGLISRSEAMVCIHRPECQQSLAAARRRLVFDEFLMLQLGLLERRASLRCQAAT